MLKKYVLPTLVGICLSFTFHVYAHDDGAYNADKHTLPEKMDWMKNIPDNTPLKHMSIPGTHRSGYALNRPEDASQAMDYMAQIKGGIRFIEVRVQHINSTLSVFHAYVREDDQECLAGRCGPRYVNLYETRCNYGCGRHPVYNMNVNDDIYTVQYGDGFGDEYRLSQLLSQLGEFLKAHPSETILLKLDPDYTYGDTYNNRGYNDSLRDEINRASDVVWTRDTENPTLKDVRGKVVIINNKPDYNSHELSFRMSDFNVQPNFNMGTNWDLYHRWELIKDKLEKAKDNKQSAIINYLTGTGGSYSYFVASGHSSPQNGAPRLMTGKTTPGWNDDVDFPRVNCLGALCSIAFEGMNTLTMEYLKKNKPTYAGIIVADFPGPNLIQSIIDSNPKITSK
ncbi:MAG: phosphatidylinositol-specific phospholipase C domain-containing protein [Parashewanella sp.]